eukprot:12488288-Alexandrium_andersonii.AAC.1
MRGSAGTGPARHEGRTCPTAAASPGKQRQKQSSAAAPHSQATGAIPSVPTHRGRGNQPPTGGVEPES